MSQFDELYEQVPISQLASRFGVDEAEMSQAVQAALPALVGGLEANAAEPSGADSLMRALSQHADTPRDVDQIDETDGQKIVSHIYGDNTDQVMQQLGGLGGSTGSLVQKLLPILAPMVLSWLAGKMGGAGGLGSILGDMFGGGRGQAAPQQTTSDVDSGPLFPGGEGAQSGPVQTPAGGTTSTGSAPAAGSNPLQDILGDVLGGAKSAGGGNILGDLLGGLLGGGRR